MGFCSGKNPDIGTLKKERGGIFSDYCTEIFKAKFLLYVNEVLFLMVKMSLKDTYLGVSTPTVLTNEVFTCRKNYFDKDTQVMVNQSINDFYTQFPFNIDALPLDIVLLLVIAATFFNNLSPDFR